MAKYHITGKGEPGLCRANKKACPLGGLDEHYDSPEAAMKAFEALQSGSFESPAFKRSKVRDSEGNLATVFHGTNTLFDSFDNSFTGHGVDAYGSGFYFSNNESSSRGYGKHMKQVQLAIENPIVASGRGGSLQDVGVKYEDVVELLKRHPDIYLNSQDAEDKDKFNPLGDYTEEYWDRPDWSKEEIDSMLKKVAKKYFSSEGNYTNLENFFGEEHGTAFRMAVKDIVGWDGVKIEFEDGLTHWVAWFPEQIRIIA